MSLLTRVLSGPPRALRQCLDCPPRCLPNALGRDLRAWRAADGPERSAVAARIRTGMLDGTYGGRVRRRALIRHERSAPRALADDLRRALDLPGEEARRSAVDRVVRGIDHGTYGVALRWPSPAQPPAVKYPSTASAQPEPPSPSGRPVTRGAAVTRRGVPWAAPDK
ncbi:hypothetical protein GCM10010515_40930 [Streptomyces fructofermentans]|uniref:Uncharacterized protein n=1 Tax=Streptomyces fructofermentans TaxID=152141 RepID=A0A918KN21_9ACTN|nr:hypothetical protein GCM10010515_40930 [Streptomyces fructofermentans]